MYLHDAEISDVCINYVDHIVVIPLKLNRPISGGFFAELLFSDIKQVNIDIYEPWGSGFYINNINIERIKEMKDYLKIIIQMNSGDAICIVAKEVIYSEPDT